MFPLSSIAIAQINVTVGDIAGNSAKILAAWDKATKSGAQLVVFPELCITGYPAQDLILSPDFRKKAMQAVQDVAAKATNGAALIIGCVWEKNSCNANESWHPEKNKEDWIPACAGMTNSALLLDGGRIIHVQPKTMLPNYGVFDEKRLFEAGNGIIPVNWRGHKIAIMVCEDVWHEAMLEPLKKQEIEAVFVINCSPFEIGKGKQRLYVARKAAHVISAPLIYANLVGGQDDIVFDGGSFVIDAAGEIICQFPRFEESVILWDASASAQYLSPAARDPVLSLRSPKDECWNAMKLGLADYVHKNGFKKVLLGLSGGIDSAVTAACAVDALGAENVLGVLLPSPYSSKDSVEDAQSSAKLLGIETRTIPITPAMEVFSEILTPEFAKTGWMEEPEIGGNLQARLRGIILMGLSNRYGSLLLSTGNKSEIAVGYSTLYGDSCGAYNVLKDIYKTKVYELANWRNQQSPAIPARSISKPPSAELKPGQRDDDNLPPYDILDDILAKHIEGRMSAEEIIASGHEQKIVEKVLRLVRLSEYKRSQSCPGVKVTSMLFGKDRRYPLTNKF
ncbi:MAG: NAD+ synthase [Rickettsiales bacterium]